MRGIRRARGGRFHTKPWLALDMLEWALDAGVPARWVVGDSRYGSDGKLRRALEARDQAYAVAAIRPAGSGGSRRHRGGAGARHWQRLTCGDGAQGDR